MNPIKITSIIPVKDSILVTDMNFKERFTSGGIIIPKDDGKSSGIRPRWAEVYAVGPKQHDVQVGDWVCVAHGRWTRGITVDDGMRIHTIRRIDNKDILIVSDEQPEGDDTLSNAV